MKICVVSVIQHAARFSLGYVDVAISCSCLMSIQLTWSQRSSKWMVTILLRYVKTIQNPKNIQKTNRKPFKTCFVESTKPGSNIKIIPQKASEPVCLLPFGKMMPVSNRWWNTPVFSEDLPTSNHFKPPNCIRRKEKKTTVKTEEKASVQVISYGYRKLIDGEVPEMYRFQWPSSCLERFEGVLSLLDP